MKTEKETSACCCQVRPPETSTPESKWSLSWHRIEPFLIAVSGLSLLASFFHWTEGILPFDPAWIAILLSGTPLLIEAASALFRYGRISVELLVSTAIIATIIADRFFPVPAGHGHQHSYLFAGGEVAFIMALGHLLEEWTIRRARAGIENLIRLTPQTARKLDGNSEQIVQTVDVFRGDLLKVLPGETVPVDGEIVSGNTSIDQALITGESIPVDKTVGDNVFGGTINRYGVFTMRATRVGEDSSLFRMIQLVRNAEQRKAPMERIADRWARFLVPIAILTALLVGTVNYFYLSAFPDASGKALESAVMRAITILVVFCPCSLVLATPTAIVAAIGNASRYGILIRSGETLERLGNVDVIAFDKTGTLTHGEPQLTSSRSFVGDYDSNGILALAASIETLSEHPLAICVVAAAVQKGLVLSQASGFQMFPGEGIVVDHVASLESGPVLLGNERLLERYRIELSDFAKSQADSRFQLGETVVWLAVGQRILGFLSLADTIRETSKPAIDLIRNIGVDVLLLTGDNERAALAVAEQSGIYRVKPNLLPEGKVEAIEELKRAGSRVGMIGDGLNDAPALKSAHVGVAMGKVGSDLTIDAADIVLVGDDISRIPFLIRLAKRTSRTIIVNIVFSMSVNAVAVLLASTGLMGPVLGALVHNAGSLIVVLNASRLLGVKKNPES